MVTGQHLVSYMTKKLYKLRLLLTELQSYLSSENVAIDESMIPFKWRTSMKRKLRKSPSAKLVLKYEK